VSNWFKFLKIDKEENPLNKLFFSDKKTFTEIMVGMFDFFNNRDKLKGKGRRDRGDRIILSDKDGAVNIHKKKETYFIDTDNKNRAEKFIKYISNLLEWDYKKDNWTWDNFNLITFNKQKLDSSAGIPKNKRFIIPNIINVYKNKPFSMAVTAGNRMEYTLLKEKINLLN